jgi:hypothetical protein
MSVQKFSYVVIAYEWNFPQWLEETTEAACAFRDRKHRFGGDLSRRSLFMLTLSRNGHLVVIIIFN